MKISEYVSIGHPDKIADYISEFILDEFIKQDTNTRYALEVQIKDSFVTLGGEITSNATVDIDQAVKDAVNSIGYTKAYQEYWGAENTICGDDLIITKHISQQSNDISVGVNAKGWGDQGIMFGMAVNSPLTDYMPRDFYLAKKLGKSLYEFALEHKGFGLDIKTLVCLDELEQIQKVIVAIPCMESREVLEEVVKACMKVCDIPVDVELVINGTGQYIKHASVGDCGTTGRKLAVDFYGGNCNIGGGAPWTKDGTKADLSLNLFARDICRIYLSKQNIDYVNCSIACAIGSSKLLISLTDKYGATIYIGETDLSPEDLIEDYGLNKPVFAKMCKEGLFTVLPPVKTE